MSDAADGQPQPLAARRRTWLRYGLGVAFAAQLAALDLLVRGGRIYLERPRLLVGVLGSVALLGLGAALARRLRWQIPLGLGLGALLVAQLAYYRYYHAPLDAQVAIAARGAWSDVRPMLVRALPVLGAAVAIVCTLEVAVLRALRPVERPRTAAAITLAAIVLVGSPRDATLEIRTVHALGALARWRAPSAARSRTRLPELESPRGTLPNVLLVLTESVRASDACPAPGCPSSPELDRALPSRITLGQARAVSSYSWLALSALATGRLQIGPRADIASAPDLFDLVRAVRASGTRYALHYWSAQLASVFERDDLPQMVDGWVTAETLLGHPATDVEDSVAAGLDRRVARLCQGSLAEIPKPMFVIAYLAGTHAPYYFDDADAPYQPWQRQVTWSGLERLHAAYRNAIREQDRSVATCVRSFLHAAAGTPWLVMYTSDHGEAFGEHAAIHHGQNLYDEQLRVPWLLAHGGGALSEAQAEALRAAAPRFVTHLDLVPTVLDLLGLLDHFALRATVSRLGGRSLLRPLVPLPPLPITNCTEAYACPINTWGMLDEGRKLVAQAWDGSWRCLALGADEREIDLGACSDLVAASRTYFPLLPNGAANSP